MQSPSDAWQREQCLFGSCLLCMSLETDKHASFGLAGLGQSDFTYSVSQRVEPATCNCMTLEKTASQKRLSIEAAHTFFWMLAHELHTDFSNSLTYNSLTLSGSPSYCQQSAHRTLHLVMHSTTGHHCTVSIFLL